MNIVIDLMGVNTLDKLRYLPRTDGGNGTILSGNIAVSLDKQHWTPVDSFRWERNGLDKEFVFAEQPQARYIRLHVDEGVGRYVSGRELYVFKVPGTETYLPGDINADGKVDEADLTSYTNYTRSAPWRLRLRRLHQRRRHQPQRPHRRLRHLQRGHPA